MGARFTIKELKNLGIDPSEIKARNKFHWASEAPHVGQTCAAICEWANETLGCLDNALDGYAGRKVAQKKHVNFYHYVVL